VRHLTYLLVLAGCLVVTAPLELVLRVRVYARWRRLLLAVLPGLVVFLAWEAYAVARHHWSWDPAQVLPVRIGGLPLEELLFFLVVPVCGVLALEAVRKVTGWDAGYPVSPSDSPGSIAARNERGADRGAEPGGDREAEE
jgi:lycopene cyclase domain-containing protein